MLKYVTKLAMDILPSVVATILGAYIVNHYIVTKPGAGAPVAAAVSQADPKKGEDKPAEKPVDVANIPEPGVKAKGISEKSVMEKSVTEKSVEKPSEKPAEKAAEKPTETTNIPTDTRRHQVTREKAVARTAPVPAPAIAAPVAVPASAPPVVDAAAGAAPIEDRRDANDLARAAIERLRGTTEGARAQGTARTPDAPRVVESPRDAPRDTPRETPRVVVMAPPVAAPSAVRPLPPPIVVSTPPAESYNPGAGSSPTSPPYTAVIGVDDPNRPTPPAEIPPPPPIDLRADATEAGAHGRKTVEHMLSAAKSMFHAVLPNSSPD
jgi:hypothetical protein